MTRLKEPEGWSELWEQAQVERDPQKLLELIDKLNNLLADWEKREQRGNARTDTSAVRRATRP